MKLFENERHEEITRLLNKQNRVTVKELIKKIGVSGATLRTDLAKMEDLGLLTRTHGGAILKHGENNEISFNVRSQKNVKEKNKIARKAYGLIKEEQCILLDGSSTTLELARVIKSKDIRLTVVTTGINAALELNNNPNIRVILLGGLLTKESNSIEGALGTDLLNHVNIDIMFTSANGFSIEDGLTDFNLYEVQLKKDIISKAKTTVGLIDSSKIQKNSSAVFAPLSKIHTIITEKSVSENLAKEIERNNIEILIGY